MTEHPSLKIISLVVTKIFKNVTFLQNDDSDNNDASDYAKAKTIT